MLLRRLTRKHLPTLEADIEAITLTSLIRQYEALYNKRSSKEAEWQLFFKDNPMILALALGHPGGHGTGAGVYRREEVRRERRNSRGFSVQKQDDQ